MEEITKEYSNGEITVVWKPNFCIHSAMCFKGLSVVFDPGKRPWINMLGADSGSIIKQVSQCPSGALSIKDLPTQKNNKMDEPGTTKIVIQKNGPILVKGNMIIKFKDGREEVQNEAWLCRCGQSGNKPFCDGSHKKCGFKDE